MCERPGERITIGCRGLRERAAQVLTEPTPLATGPGNLLCLFAAKGDWRASGPDRTLTLAQGDSLVSSAALGLTPMDRGAAIVVPLFRV